MRNVSHSSLPLLAQAHRLLAVAVTCFAVMVVQPATAQEHGETGPYAVVRAGAQVDADLKSPKSGPTVGVMPRDVDAKPGFTGELGLGYDFGGFRLEGTAGYESAKLDGKRLSDTQYRGAGRMKSLDLGLSGYADLNPGGRLNPFVGGGIGISRVDAKIARVAPVAGTPSAQPVGTRVNERDWGFRWHLDAGVAYSLTPTTAVELAGRYSRVSALDFTAATRATATAVTTSQAYKPQLATTSVMVGLRHRF